MIKEMLGGFRAFISHHPPLAVFTLCIIFFAVATQVLASYVLYSEKIPNAEAASEWKNFVNTLSDLEICLLPKVAPPASKLNSSLLNSSISMSAAIPHDERDLTLESVSVFRGSVDLKGWSRLCKSSQTPQIEIQNRNPYSMDIVISSNMELCITILGPRELLPSVFGVRHPCSNGAKQPTTIIDSTGVKGSLISRKVPSKDESKGTKDWCSSGTVIHPNYPDSVSCPVILLATLSHGDRLLIHTHLLQISFFLSALAALLVIYAALRGRRLHHQHQHQLVSDKDPLET